jgi:hypothetical protein
MKGFIKPDDKTLVICKDCQRKYTKYMVVAINNYDNTYWCVRCYNRRNKQWQNYPR